MKGVPDVCGSMMHLREEMLSSALQRLKEREGEGGGGGMQSCSTHGGGLQRNAMRPQLHTTMIAISIN